MKLLENLNKISPRLTVDEKSTGSCVIVEIESTTYVFTAKHCLRALVEKISLDFYDIKKSNFQCYEYGIAEFEMIIPDDSVDLVILKILSTTPKLNIPNVKIAKDIFSENKDYLIRVC